jgi:hypothetical protein
MGGLQVQSVGSSLPQKFQCFEWNARAFGAAARAAGKALLIPAEAVARRHHTLTSDRTATFAAVAVELVTLLDAESNTSEVKAVQQLVTLNGTTHHGCGLTGCCNVDTLRGLGCATITTATNTCVSSSAGCVAWSTVRL